MTHGLGQRSLHERLYAVNLRALIFFARQEEEGRAMEAELALYRMVCSPPSQNFEDCSRDSALALKESAVHVAYFAKLNARKLADKVSRTQARVV
jgi:hypothetical protein